MTNVRLNSRSWSIHTVAASGTRRSVASEASSLPTSFLAREATVAIEFVATPMASSGRGPVSSGPLDFSYQLEEGENAILAVRHPSGALTFHLPVESMRRGPGQYGEVRFSITVNSVEVEAGRRGLVSQAIKAILIKVGKLAADKAVSLVLPKLANSFEKTSWQKRHLKEGWVKVTKDALAKQSLPLDVPRSTERSLLLIHGTFSHAASAFSGLSKSHFFEKVSSIYGDRIYAFNHFTVSRTPEENARMLLEALEDKEFEFDVITHSRGGLVLRNLVERAQVFGSLSRRFKLGNAVLVASPNDGTPLATPSRWQETVGWVANLLELFPENPFTTGPEFVAHGLVWLARHASGDLPGISSMDGHGQSIADLQGPPGPPPNSYSALVSNYNPTKDVLHRLIDTGVDQFFGTANDLVVPTEGGWMIDHSGHKYISGDRVGCYGPGGNLSADSVTHIDFFSLQESVDFIVAALVRTPQNLPSLDLDKSLPNRRLFRSADGVDTAIAPKIRPVGEMKIGTATVNGKEVIVSDTFHLVVLSGPNSDQRHAKILAQYGSARVLEDFHLGGTETDAGKRWQQIIRYQRQIKQYIDEHRGAMPNANDLQDFGKVLFATLFPGAVRRLYDTARSIQRSERLSVILTSTIPWVADLPWEFCFDPVRHTSISMEELHFIRNVMTAVPAEIIDDRQRLRILVASAQPMSLGKLSVKEEEAVIRRGFEPLCESGLAEVEVLARATPASLHGYVSTGRYSVVHFIGHGEYDRANDNGFLVFQDDEGNPYKVDERSIRRILCGRSIRLIFLNACETGQGGSADFNSGVAPALVAGGVPIVVANQYRVLDTSATFFAQHFYWSLAQGMEVGQAVREARIAVDYSLTGESIDWAIPVLYARDPKSRLCPELGLDPRTSPSPAVGVAARRGTRDHSTLVAVWDVHSQFPALRSTLNRLNAVQQYYGFEVVDLSVPIDSWYYKRGNRYIDADKFAERLAPQISLLGVEYLAVIVDEPIAIETSTKNPQFDYYGWMPPADKPPVLIFSTKDLGLPPTGPGTDRAVANVAVSGIAGYLMGGATHSKGQTGCPNYLNPSRKLELITGRETFCRPCTAKLIRSHPEELKALNAILAAFD